MLKIIMRFLKKKDNYEQAIYFLKKEKYNKFFTILDSMEDIEIKKLSTQIDSLHISLDEYNKFISKLIILSKDKEYDIKDFKYAVNKRMSLRKWVYRNNVLHSEVNVKLKLFIKNGVDITNIYENLDRTNNILISIFFKQYIINMCKIVTTILNEKDR